MVLSCSLLVPMSLLVLAIAQSSHHNPKVDHLRMRTGLYIVRMAFEKSRYMVYHAWQSNAIGTGVRQLLLDGLASNLSLL